MIGKRVKQKREEHGWTQLQLARKMGYVSKSTIGKIESDINDVPLSKVEKFADVLGTTPEWLMGWEQEIVEKAYYEKIIALFKTLDRADQMRIEERISTLLEGDKYRVGHPGAKKS